MTSHFFFASRFGKPIWWTRVSQCLGGVQDGGKSSFLIERQTDEENMQKQTRLLHTYWRWMYSSVPKWMHFIFSFPSPWIHMTTEIWLVEYRVPPPRRQRWQQNKWTQWCSLSFYIMRMKFKVKFHNIIYIFLCVELYLPAGYLVFFFVYMHEAKELDKIKWKRFFFPISRLSLQKGTRCTLHRPWTRERGTVHFGGKERQLETKQDAIEGWLKKHLNLANYGLSNNVFSVCWSVLVWTQWHCFWIEICRAADVISCLWKTGCFCLVNNE